MMPLLAMTEQATTAGVTSRLSVDDVLSPYVYVFYAAFIVSFLFTPVMRIVASYYGIVDKPDGLRKIHREPVAYLGGVAVFLGWLAGLTFAQFLVLHRAPLQEIVGAPKIPFAIAAGGIVIMLLGLFDDIRGISPKIKIGGQILAAGLLLSQKIGIKCMYPVVATIDERLYLWTYSALPPGSFLIVPEWVAMVASAGFVVALVVFCCNAANLMDGMDGLCGGVTAIIAAGYVFLAVHIATGGTQFPTNTDAVRVIIALALLGGVLGFVPYNFNPASIFMGDTGSMFLGFAIATLMLMMGEVASKWLLAAMVMFALPTLDTGLAFVRRYVNGRPFFSADKHHIHHQFLARGLSVKQTVLFLYGSSILFVLLGSSIALMRTRYSVAMYLVIFGCIVVAAYKMGMVHEKVKSAEKPNPIGPDDRIVSPGRGDNGDGVLELPDNPPRDPSPARA